jgi:hypothetical protein
VRFDLKVYYSVNDDNPGSPAMLDLLCPSQDVDYPVSRVHNAIHCRTCNAELAVKAIMQWSCPELISCPADGMDAFRSSFRTVELIVCMFDGVIQSDWDVGHGLDLLMAKRKRDQWELRLRHS